MTTHIALTKLEQQYLLEEEMRDAGITRYLNMMQEAKVEHLETSTDAGLQLLKRTIEPLADAFKDYLKAEAEKQRGRKSIAVGYLCQLEPEVLAFLTAKTVLNSVTSEISLIQTSLNIATVIEDELRLRFYQEQNPCHYSAVFNRIRNKNSYDYKRTVLVHSMGKLNINWEPWPKTNKVHLGQLCLELLIESTRYVEIMQIPKKVNDTGYYVVPTQAALDWLQGEHQRCALLAPTYMPMLVPPKDWTTPKNGGYVGVLADTLKLVKTHNPKYLEEIGHVDMPAVYQAVNHIQQTAWRINNRVLDIAQALWEGNCTTAGIPSREDNQPRPCPLPKTVQAKDMTPEQLTIFQTWKREAAKIYDANITNRSKRLLYQKVLYVADKFANEKEIYFPHILDFRGRVYPMANFLNPQGNDFAKGLLTFANGKPLENQQAANWLAIHGANVYGRDKSDFADRLGFVEAFTPTIQAIAEDPLNNLEWTEAKKPWQFLAFCFEWAEYKQLGKGFVSCLPVALDGTCNGLQHFSAMLRDEVGGAAVNLIPSDKPQDIYQRVADVVIEKLKADDSEMARQWLAFGVSRDITKRPVMILPYGGTRLACRSYIEEHIHKRLLEGQSNIFATPEDDKLFQASQFLANLVWEAIGEVVVAAREVMGWLRKASRLVSDEGLPIQWWSPSGFPVYQAYFDVKTRRIKTQLSGNVIRKIYLCLNESLDTLNKQEQANGISPNFIHSMDAGVLHLYVNLAKELGIESFSLVHDSYGTLAANTELSASCIRDVFIQVYRNDVLGRFRSDLIQLLSPNRAEKLPKLPSRGCLDLETVRQSQFFFA